jgi:polysaccharide biosynthesis PFTS motif protein
MYLRKISQLSEKVNYTSIDPGLDALNIIQQTKACISMPFTSTALIAKHEGKPSVYYDPSGMICKDDRAAHGIPVLNNIDELQQWIEEVNKV